MTQANAFSDLMQKAQGEPKQPANAGTGRDQIATMNNADLLQAVDRNPQVAVEIVRVRPSETAEVIQAALAAGDAATADALTAALKRDYLNAWGTGSECDLLFRGAMRLQGAHADEVRDLMHLLVTQTTKRENDSLVIDVRPKELRGDLAGHDRLLEAAAKDPGFGRIYADFHDRPEAAAQQLLDEARSAPAAFKRHAAVLGDLMRRSPAAASPFVHAVMQLREEGAINVKRWVVTELDNAIQPEVRMMNAGYNDMIDGGPRVRAERLVPLLAEIVAQPDVAQSLVEVRVAMGHDLPAHMPSLKGLLQDVLWASWSKEVQRDVRSSINHGAADMFHDALVQTDPKHRSAQSGKTAAFIATAAEAERSVGLEPSLAKTIGEMLKAISKFMPTATQKKITDAGGSLLSASAPHTDSQWTRHALDLLMRRVYEDVNPRPEGPDDNVAVQEYNTEYWNWSRVPAEQFAVLSQEKP